MQDNLILVHIPVSFAITVCELYAFAYLPWTGRTDAAVLGDARSAPAADKKQIPAGFPPWDLFPDFSVFI